jgi:hypothetical protein
MIEAHMKEFNFLSNSILTYLFSLVFKVLMG